MFSPEGRRVRVVLGSPVSPRLPSAQTDPADLWDLALHQHPAGGSDITNTLTPQPCEEWLISLYSHVDPADPEDLGSRRALEDPEERQKQGGKNNEKKEKASKYNYNKESIYIHNSAVVITDTNKQTNPNGTHWINDVFRLKWSVKSKFTHMLALVTFASLLSRLSKLTLSQ